MEYKLFKNHFRDRATGQLRTSAAWNVRFADHLGRRQTLAASPREREAHTLAGFVGELVRCRQTGEPLPPKLAKWLEVQPDKIRQRLGEMDLIDARSISVEKLLMEHLDGRKDADENIIEPGYRQALASRGNTDHHVAQQVDRIKTLFDECGFIFWRDLSAPGASTRIEVHLGRQRTAGDINGATFNHYIGAIKGFCRWMAQTGKAPAVALASLKRVQNAESDAKPRRELSVAEMRLLIQTAKTGPTHSTLTGPERATLYQFAFESGMRPKQIRALAVADFRLTDSPPTVTAKAQHVKRRKPHTQVMRPALAAELARQFASKMPEAKAFKMPSKWHQAEMLRRDLASAREAWIAAAADDRDRGERLRSDFLADKDYQGQRTDFYSIRHGHGTALAEAGVPQKDIQASLHHTNPTTTARYLHSSRKSLTAAVAAMPEVNYSEPQLATGTDCSVANLTCHRNATATGTSDMDSYGQTGMLASVEDARNSRENAFLVNSPRGGTADASDLKSDGP